MTKALFLSLPLTGHTDPSLPLVRELASRGDTIVYYSTAAYAARIEQAGAKYRPYRNAFLADLRSLPERTHELSWLLMRTTAEVLEEELDGFRAERPDYLITDSIAPWGQWVAEILGIPAVTSVTTFAINRRVLAFAVKSGIRPKSGRLLLEKLQCLFRAVRLGRRLQRQYGVRGPGITGIVFGRSALNIVYTSRAFQPCAESFDDSFQFIGPCVSAREENVEFPWEQLRHPTVLYLSFGTLFNADEGLYRKCFDAFRDMDLQVILSLGANVTRERLGPVPPNFLAQEYVPQLEALGRAAAFVSHGGMNSVNESLAYGVPVLVIPQTGEQALAGRRVELLGAGLFLAKEDATAETLRAAVARLLREEQFRRQAGLLRESFETAGGVARAADAIVAFTR